MSTLRKCIDREVLHRQSAFRCTIKDSKKKKKIGGGDTHSSESRHAPGPTISGASHQIRMKVWTPTLLCPKMPPGPTSPGQEADQDEGVDTHSSESRHAPGWTSSGASHQIRMKAWTPTLLSPKMPLGPTSPGQGSDQDEGVDTHSSESRDAPGPTSSGTSHQTRMEEWIPTLLSPKIPRGPTSSGQGSDQDGGVDTHLSESRDAPGPTSAGQGSDQDGGVDTHSSESRHAPGLTSSGASYRTRVEEWIPTHPSPKMPLVRPVLGRGQTRMKEWIPTHLSPDMPLV